jgi:1A family penicillin-binding protein
MNPLLAAAIRERQRQSSGVNRLVLVVLGASLGLIFISSVAFAWYIGIGSFGDVLSFATRDLPSVDEVFSKGVAQSAFIYDRKGRLLYELYDPQGGRRTLVHLKDIPPVLIAATLSTEDVNFYSNPGIDPTSIVRAIGQDILHHQLESGASTITQQLVRNVLMTPEERQSRSLTRKIEEAILAFRVDERYSKDEILERYLNEISYGNLANGVEAASETYFNKPVQQLTLAEAALLAGLPAAPSAYDPYQNPDAAKARQRDVLDLLVKHGYITQEQADSAYNEPLHYHRAPEQLQAPHFVMYVRTLLEQQFSQQQLYQSGLRVYTTLDLDAQRQAEEIAKDRLGSLKQYNANNAAIVAIDPKTGEILAMVGSADFWDDSIQGQINMATAERQPGSTLKPFNYLYAFQQRLATPTTILQDSPITYSMGAGQPPYQPHDADFKFRGPVTVRRALATSLNVPAVQMLSKIGVGALLGTLHQFGITSLRQLPTYYGLGLTLGDGPVKLVDLTYAYATLANGGVQVGQPVSNPQPGMSAFAPVAILKVTDSQGKVLTNYQPPSGAPLASPPATWLITDILADDAARAEAFGAHSYLELDRPAAAKTGTTEQFQDSWTVGYTPQLVVGVWVGNASDKPMDSVFGARGAGLIWHDLMTAMLKSQSVVPFQRPAGLVQITVDKATGGKPASGRPTITDWFIDGTQPTSAAPAASGSSPVPVTATLVPTATTLPATSTPAPTPTTKPPTATPNPNLVAVPNLVGMPEAAAQQLITQSGLMTTYVNYQTANEVPDRSYFLSIPPGSVLSQLPQPGTQVPKGTKVFIAVRKS